MSIERKISTRFTRRKDGINEAVKAKGVDGVDVTKRLGGAEKFIKKQKVHFRKKVQMTAKEKMTPAKVVVKKTETFLSEKASKKRGSKKITKPVLGIKKKYLKNKNICKTTFKLAAEAVPDAQSVYIVGDFNGWSIHADRMKKMKNGDHNIILDLEPGKEYQFRYLIDDSKWENDWKADKYVKSPYGDSENSVVVV